MFVLFHLESYAPNLWLTVINRFQLKPSVFIRLYEKKLLKLLVDDYVPTRVSFFKKIDTSCGHFLREKVI